VARASWSPGEARIVSSEGERRFASLDDLGRELLGEPVPIAALFDWLRGRPTELAPSRWIDGLRSFEQLGWRVDLGQFTEGRLRLDRHGTVRVELRVVLDAPAPAP
jgi:outer membrane lipoprotein LolB